MTDQSNKNGPKQLVAFLSQYGLLLENQLLDVKSILTESFNSVMTGVSNLSEATGAKKLEAESAIDAVYLNPDQETTELVDKVQASVDDIFEAAKADSKKSSPDKTGIDASQSTSMARLQEKFSNKIDDVNNIEASLQALLYQMVGSLSADDVVSQRIAHVSSCLRAMQLGLANIMVDFPGRCTTDDISKFEKDLLRFTESIYTMSVERKLLKELFILPKSA